jgi:RNA 2',3'-cyclic 3'-phosphodiesterase
MILPPVVRVFFAAALPKDINDLVAHYIDELKTLSRTNKIRWTRAENLHITLQFLPEVKGEDVPNLLSCVENQLLAAHHPVSFHLRDLHLFPDPHRPRVIVMGVAPQSPLAEWSTLIGKGIQEAGYEIEDRPFRAHLTLARIKTSQTKTLNFLQEAVHVALPEIRLDEVVLFQSEPHPDGSHYIPLARLPLGQAPAIKKAR